MAVSIWSTFHRLLAVSLVLGCTLTAGCTAEPKRAAAVDAAQAREALRTTLETWKTGEKPDALKARSPAITVQDMDWGSGLRLVDFELVGEGVMDDANLRCPVKLTLHDGGGRTIRKDVKYVVGTSPRVTMFRELIP